MFKRFSSFIKYENPNKLSDRIFKDRKEFIDSVLFCGVVCSILSCKVIVTDFEL